MQHVSLLSDLNQHSHFTQGDISSYTHLRVDAMSFIFFPAFRAGRLRRLFIRGED